MKKIIAFATLSALALAGCAAEGPKSTSKDGSVETDQKPAVPQSDPSGNDEPTPAKDIAVPDVVGLDLQLAQDTMQSAGLYNLTSHDSTGQDRSQLIDRNWKVTEQSPAAGTKVDAGQLVDLGAKKFTD